MHLIRFLILRFEILFRKYQLEKMYFFLDGAIGKPYGSTFEVKGTKLTLIEGEETEGDQELSKQHNVFP